MTNKGRNIWEQRTIWRVLVPQQNSTDKTRTGWTCRVVRVSSDSFKHLFLYYPFYDQNKIRRPKRGCKTCEKLQEIRSQLQQRDRALLRVDQNFESLKLMKIMSFSNALKLITCINLLLCRIIPTLQARAPTNS